MQTGITLARPAELGLKQIIKTYLKDLFINDTNSVNDNRRENKREKGRKSNHPVLSNICRG